jgi:hypothetical protein
MTKNLLVEVSHIEFKENLANGIGSDTWSQTDGQI